MLEKKWYYICNKNDVNGAYWMKKLQQFNIFAFTFDRLKNNNFNIEITPLQADLNEELIALADNECLRAIRRITDHPFDLLGDLKLQSFFDERKKITRQKNSDTNRKRIAEINNKIRELLFIPEVVSVTTPKKRDYSVIGKNGFFVNGVHYRRLMCSAAMARTNRALFCADSIYEKLDEVLRCGCKQIKLVPAKWNAYYSLMSSAAFQVSFPRVCVVPDYEIEMVKTIDWTVPNEHEDEIVRMDKALKFNIWDGMGLISPKMAEIWSEEIGYEGIAESFIIRAPFIKGLLATFDFHAFSEEIAKSKTIKDIYGNLYNCDDIDVILTESQFKLWNAYDSIEQHQDNMCKYGLSWGVTRIGAPEAKKTMRTNYQFIQVLNMTDEDIAELCKPTIEWLYGVSGGSYEKKLLYLLGKSIRHASSQKIWDNMQDPAIKALMLEPKLVGDEYLSNKILQSLRKKIKETYIGKLVVNGGFNFVYSDPYALAEYCFGMEPNGLLKEFEFYADFWSEKGIKEIIGMRSPLTWRAEVNKLTLKHSEEMNKWYKYIPNGVVYNIWGLDRETHSSMDFDGDIVATTDNSTFLKCRYGGVPVLYQSQKAEKDIIEK